MVAFVALLVLAFLIYLAVTRPLIAFLASIPATACLWLLVVRDGGSLSMTITLLLLPITLITILIAKSSEPRYSCPTKGKSGRNFWIQYLFTSLVYAVIAIGSLTLIAGLLAVAGALAPLVLIFLVVLGYLFINFALTSRQVRALEILSTLGAAMRQNLPVPTALEAAAENGPQKQARIYRDVAQWLTRGFSLSEALDLGYPRCPGHILAMIAMAERVDQVPTAIDCLEKDLLEKSNDINGIRPVHPLYPFLLIVMQILIFTGFMIFIIPKYREIFDDFDVVLPESTQILLAVATQISRDGWLAASLTFLLLFLVPFSVYIKFRTRTPQNPRWLSVWGDWIKWYLPLLRGFEWKYALVQVTAYLRLALRAGVRVDRAIAHTSGLDVNERFRHKLKHWSADVEQGENIAIAARRHGLGRGVAWAFDQKVNPNNAPEILEILERLYRRSYRMRLLLARYIFWPCFMVLIGLLVGFVVYAMFTPIVAMIDAVALDVIP